MTTYVHVSVPEPLLVEVYALLASQNRTEQTHLSESELATTNGWTKDELCRAYLESQEGPKLVLEYLANRPDEWVSYGDLAAGIGRETNQLRGILGAFTRRLKNRYQKEDWPFEWLYDAERKRSMYCMSALNAAIIEEVAG